MQLLFMVCILDRNFYLSNNVFASPPQINGEVSAHGTMVGYLLIVYQAVDGGVVAAMGKERQ